MREITLTPQAPEDIAYWLRQDRKVLQRLLKLIGEAARNPSTGPANPSR